MKNWFGFVLILLSSASAWAANPVTAMVLAARHFNKAEQKVLEPGGPEYKFMFSLLDVVSEQVPGVADITRVQPLPGEGMVMIGESSQRIELLNDSGHASFDDKVVLTYIKGWGDCFAGCISHHKWTVEVTPIKPEKVDADYTFSVRLVSESGDLL